MTFARPMAALVLPLLLLALAGAVVATGGDGLSAQLRPWLWDLWQGWAPASKPAFTPALAMPATLAGLILAGGIAVFLTWRSRPYWAGLFTALVLALAFGGGWLLYRDWHWRIDVATPGLGLVLVLLAAILMRLAEIRALRIRLRLAFAGCLPSAAIERIARRPRLLALTGESRTVSYLVCGVRGLTGLSAFYRDDPKRFTRLTQRMLSPLLDQVLAYGGTIDRLTADGFAAFWNAPLDDPHHAIHACEAAHGMSVMAGRVSEQLAQEEGARPVPVEIAVGIATGPAIAGSFGDHGRLGYSVNGEAVALAAHIQALAPHYGPAVIVSEETRQAAARGFAFLEVDCIAAGPEGAPVRLYAMLGNPVVRASPKFRALIVFHEHIFRAIGRRQWDKARELIEQCRRLSGASQTLYDLHLARIRYFEANPPGPEWDGAFRPILK